MRKQTESPAAAPYRGRTSEDYPAVQFDPERRANFHVESDGTRRYHEVPVGFEFDESGTLRKVNTNG